MPSNSATSVDGTDGEEVYILVFRSGETKDEAGTDLQALEAIQE